MSHPAPRHALPEQPRSRTPLVVGGAVVAAVAIAAGAVAVTTGHDQDNASAASASAAASSTCGTSAVLAVDPAWSRAVTAAAKSWQASTNSSCARVAVDARTSADVARSGLGNDAAWIPEDTTWVTASKDATLKAAKPTVVGSSPLVVVDQADAATALGTPLDHTVLGRMLTGEQTWADHGHKEWGTLKLVLPTVDTTATGALAYASLAAQAAAVAPAASAGSLNPVASSPQQAAMAKVQQRLVDQVDVDSVPQKLAPHASDATALTPAGPRTGVTTEASALADGTTRASYLDDHTGVQMSVVNPASNAVVKDFTTWLGSTDGQKALAASGVRTTGQSPAADRLARIGLPARAPKVTANDAKALAGARQLLAVSSRRAAALMVLDTSGSMAQPLDDSSSMRKIDIVLQMTLQGWSAWPPGMTTGLMTFNATNDAAQRPVITTVVPLTRNDTAAWVKGAAQYQSALKQLKVTGGTPLYQAIEKAYTMMQAGYVQGMPNKIIVVTDGSSQDASGEPTLSQLLAALPKAPDSSKPIQVIYVALGPQADFATLQQIATATHQTAVQVDSVADLQSKMGLLFS